MKYPFCLASALFGVLVTGPLASATPPIHLKQAQKEDGSPWINMADPAGVLNEEQGITDAEATVFDSYGKLLVTCSKADGRHPSENHGKSAHVSVWNVETGELVWDRKRSRADDEDGDGFPDDQPKNREDEVEIALFSPDGRFVAAGGEDDKIEVWRVREDDHGPDEWLTDPVLETTFSTGDGDQETDDAGVDAMGWSHDGRLLFAGTEEAGKIEVFVTQGDPADWKFIHKADHGGQKGWAVNSLDITEDDKFLGSVGTDTYGVFWRLDVTEDAEGKISAVELVKLATMRSLAGKGVEGSGREARFETNGDRHFIFTLERRGVVQVYDVEELKAYDGPVELGPAPIEILTNGDKVKDGNEIEPASYSSDGRFLVVDGDSRVRGNTDTIFPGYLRVYETKEIQPNVPMPDPVFVQRALATEFISFTEDDTMLASGHGDGSVRVWETNISGAETIASEAFNEPGELAQRWTLTGHARPDNSLEIFWGSSAHVMHKTSFVGHRGLHYIAAGNLRGQLHQLDLNKSWDISGFSKRGVQFAAAGAPSAFEEGDFLKLLADADGDGEFEIVVAEFLPDSNGDLALVGDEERKLASVFLDDDKQVKFYNFEDYFIDLEPLLPEDFGGKIRFRVEASTDAADEEIAFDSLRVTGLK